jgi:hypothetical protein
MNKHFAFVLAVSLLTTLGWFGSAYPAAAAETATCEPTVTTKEVKETSVKLKITCANFTKTKVTMKVLITNKETDKDSTKTVKATLGKTGSVTIKMSGLDSATEYGFKVKVKKTSASKYSAYSTSVDATTKGADYDITIDKINGVTEDSVKLHIQSDDLESERVNVLAAYKKKHDWNTKSFTLTLDGDGEGSFTLDGLKSGTEYSFKVKIREDGESSYSKYSEIKKETTDED